MRDKNDQAKYTCSDYREEMILVALQRKLNKADLSEEQKARLRQEIAELETKMGL